MNLGSIINSAFCDSAPTISTDERTLYFASMRREGADADIYVTRREHVGPRWDELVNVGTTINTTSNELTPALSQDGRQLFFVSPRASGPSDIWVSYRRKVDDDLAWETPVLLGPAINTAAIDSVPHYFESQKLGLPQLYFNSTRPGGLGASDIYVANAFGPAVLVLELNSPQNDVGPTMSPDGLEIYFTSDRPGGDFPAGVNPRDRWVSTRRSVFDPWSQPELMGPTVDSPWMEQPAAISADGETLFFTSERPGGFGLYDSYMTTRSRRGRH